MFLIHNPILYKLTNLQTSSTYFKNIRLFKWFRYFLSCIYICSIYNTIIVHNTQE